MTLGIGALIFYFVPPKDIVADLKNVEIQWHYLPLFLLAVLANLYLRGKTLALLLNSPDHISSGRWMTISSAHNMSTSLSGMILGDAVLVWLLNRFDIHWQKSLFTTLIARVFELPMLLALLFLGLLGSPTLFPAQEVWVWLSGLAFIASFSLLFFLNQAIDSVPHRLWFGQRQKALAFGQAYRALSDRCMSTLLLLSAGKIAAAFLFYTFAMRLFSIDQSLWEEFFVFGVFNFASLFPIQGILGLGTFEAYFSLGLVLLGWVSATVLVLAFCVHMLFLITFLLIALCCFVFLVDRK